MAPETLVKSPVFSKKTDIWAYGVLLYEVKPLKYIFMLAANSIVRKNLFFFVKLL